MSLIKNLMGAGEIITGNILVVNGMSIMLGVGGAGVTLGNGITSKLCEQKGWTEDNHSVSGSTIDDLLSDLTQIPSYIQDVHRYWLYGEVINSVGYKINNAAQYMTKLETLLSHVNEIKGWPKNRMKVIDGFYATSTNWDSYPVTPPYATTSQYLSVIASSGQACDYFGIQHNNLYDWMQVNIGDGGLDSFGRHPLDTVTNSIATFYGQFLN